MTELSGQIACQETRLAEKEAAADCDERFAALVMRQSRFIFRVAYSVLRNVPDSEDVVQETFLKLYRAGTWQRMNDERAFMARTAWRIAIDRLRKRRRGRPTVDNVSVAENAEQVLMVADWNSRVHQLIDALPEQLREPLALSTVEELTSPEIASVLGIPEGTVRYRLMRARQILKQKLAAAGVGRYGK